jgi:hypothetical protein
VTSLNYVSNTVLYKQHLYPHFVPYSMISMKLHVVPILQITSGNIFKCQYWHTDRLTVNIKTAVIPHVMKVKQSLTIIQYRAATTTVTNKTVRHIIINALLAPGMAAVFSKDSWHCFKIFYKEMCVLSREHQDYHYFSLGSPQCQKLRKYYIFYNTGTLLYILDVYDNARMAMNGICCIWESKIFLLCLHNHIDFFTKLPVNSHTIIWDNDQCSLTKNFPIFQNHCTFASIILGHSQSNTVSIEPKVLVFSYSNEST